MSHPRLNNPRARLAKVTEAMRVKRAPRHARFRADQAVSELWQELTTGTLRPMYHSGSADVAVISIGRGVNVWCREGKFIWNDAAGGTVSHPANDPAGCAAKLRRIPLLSGGLPRPVSTAA
ncbi:hypothetical protein RIF23_07230 [Lipingzhangella sp. LS1_29]|uniref:Uncharacterized protein n=1 Tax=Lipingzhangella rawalii TaxID=2055835 RepID=A0ABU2H459_9ACTN|nr:hypothetical protein [Lipingzhangella rawalii]MDS1270083.1 hypothetical protein [Lipingzhangella rawalii]